jgi:hypothetical protein
MMTYDKLSDDVLKQIAEGSGHAYRHEAKSMARELIEFQSGAGRGHEDAAAGPVAVGRGPVPTVDFGV